MATISFIPCAFKVQTINKSIKSSTIKRKSIFSVESSELKWNKNQHFGMDLKIDGIKWIQELPIIKNNKLHIESASKNSKDINEKNNMFHDRYLKVEVLNVWAKIETSTKMKLLTKDDGIVEVEYLNKNRKSYSKLDERVSHIIALKVLDGSNVILELPTHGGRGFHILDVLKQIRSIYLPTPRDLTYFTNPLETSHMELRRAMITHKSKNVYHAKIYKAWKGSSEEHSINAKSAEDAIEMALWRNLPIYINKDLLYDDGIRLMDKDEIWILEELKFRKQDHVVEKMPLIPEAAHLEIQFLIALKEERYTDAAKWKQILLQKHLESFRSYDEKNILDKETRSYIHM